MAETFYRFPKLPPELRLKIWEQALIEARPHRRIIVYDHRVVPFKQLISPLLLVNFESRGCAKAFYNVKLDIFAAPPVSLYQVEVLDKEKLKDQIPGIERAVDGKITGYTDHWVEWKFVDRRTEVIRALLVEYNTFDEGTYSNRTSEEFSKITREEARYTVDLEKHWSDYVRRKLRLLRQIYAVEAGAPAPTTGAVYISPEHDVFITDYDCGVHYCIESISKILGGDIPELQDIACHHISAKLTSATCERVSTLALARVSSSTKHCVFSERRVIGSEMGSGAPRSHAEKVFNRHWRKKTFPGVCEYFVLRFPVPDSHKFLERVIGADDVELSQYLEQWGKIHSSTNQSGVDARVLEMKKGNRSGVEKADWVRDLMAHWGIRK